MKKLGFLGAMNRDIVVQRPFAAIMDRLDIDAVPLLETPVSDAAAQRGAEIAERMGAASHLGGSAFNAARVAALLNSEQALELAFFGVAGTFGGHAPHRQALEAWAIDATGVTDADMPPATCLALVEPAGRTLLTAPGANAGVVAWLRQNRQRLAEAIARCDIIHVTSYIDPAAPDAVADLLEAAICANPALVVSLDPGMAWIAPGGTGLERLMALTGILHLNAEEFGCLGGSSDIRGIGDRLLPNWLVVGRTHDGAALYCADQGPRHLPARPLPAGARVIDATGAGDTFCGGFLWRYCTCPDQPVHAAALGFDLARLKIAMAGPLTPTDQVRHAIATHRP